jgi:hypothetical protein
LAVVRDGDEITAVTSKETNHGEWTKWVCYFRMLQFASLSWEKQKFVVSGSKVARQYLDMGGNKISG